MKFGRENYTIYHVSVFVLTFISYSLMHAIRKTLATVKTTISETWTPSIHNETVCELQPNYLWNKHTLFENNEDAVYFLGALDTIFMTSYAVGLFISGAVGDRLSLRYVLCFGMISTAIVVLMFGFVLEFFQYYNIYLYGALWMINGLVQSTGWPAVVTIMGNWFGKSSRGLVMGVWSACLSIGNILGALMSSSVLDYGYNYAFLFTSVLLFSLGVIDFFALITSPKEVGLPIPVDHAIDTVIVDDRKPAPDESHADTVVATRSIELNEQRDDGKSNEHTDISDAQPKKQGKAIGFIAALKLPGVVPYSLSHACLKLVHYSFFFWLPFYLANSFHWKEKLADEISIWYDVGGIIGGAVAGFTSDRLGRRAVVVSVFLIAAIPAIVGYTKSPNDQTINAVLLGVVGFFIGGVANLLASVITADLGRQDAVAGNTKALATVTGIVTGTGSIGASVGQVLVPVIEIKLGWKWVFYFFILMITLTLLNILPILIREIKMWRNSRTKSVQPSNGRRVSDDSLQPSNDHFVSHTSLRPSDRGPTSDTSLRPSDRGPTSDTNLRPSDRGPTSDTSGLQPPTDRPVPSEDETHL